MKSGPSLLGLKKIVLPPPRGGETPEKLEAAAKASFGPVAGPSARRRDEGLVEFLGRVTLFEEFGHGDLVRLARSAHERNYQDGERIYEQGTPGAALFIVRSGIVEIRHRHAGGEEIPLVALEPPASFSEDAAMGAQAVRWTSAVARGPVSLVALGSSDLDALGQRFPQLTIKILRSLGQITALRLHLVLEAQLFGGEIEVGTVVDRET